MRKTLVVLGLVCLSAAVAAGEPQWYPVGMGGSAVEKPCITTSTQGTDRILFDVDISGFVGSDGFTKGGVYRQLLLPGETTAGEIGQGQLPRIRRMVEVPEGATLKVSVEPGEALDLPLARFGFSGDLMPVQESILKTPDGYEKWTFRKDGTYYGTDAFLPQSPVRVGKIAMYRGHQVAQVDIFPLSYNPAKGVVRIYTHLRFELVMAGGDADRTKSAVTKSWSPAFEDEYSRTFVNYGQIAGTDALPSTRSSSWDGILMISAPAYSSYAAPLAAWRKKMGYKVELVTTATTGTTTTAIKSYIQNAYNTWSSPGLAFVVLIGDTDTIPSPDGTNCSSCASDSDYACLSGGDNIHDVYLGRISLSSTAQATEVFGRFMDYAKADFTQTPWIEKACFSASCDSTYNSYDTHEYCQATYTLPEGYTGEYYPGSTDPGGDLIRCIEDYGGSETASGADVVNAMNHGRSMVVYSGHGGVEYWAGPEVVQSDLTAATCGEMAPFMVGHCCVAHSIRSASFGEACVREVAIGYWGSSNNSQWGEDDYIQKAWFQKIFTGGQRRIGEFMINAMIDFYNNYSTSEDDYYMDMCLLGGDPAMELFTEEPATLSVTHDAALIVGQSSFAVTVYKAGAPLQNARVCLTKNDGGDDIHEFGLTNASGQLTITFTPVPAGVGTLNVTATAYDSKPYEGTATVIVPEGPYLSYQSHLVNDSAGNGDGIANPGEAIILPVTVKNIGADPGTGLTGTLTSADPNVTITDGAASFPNLAVDATGQSLSNHFAITVAGGCPNGHLIPLDLAWTATGGYSGTMRFNVAVCAPLTISNVTVSNITGNSALVAWTTSVASTSRVTYGTSVPPGTNKDDAALVTNHSVALTGLSQCTPYFFSVTSQSPGCYTATNSNGGAYFTFATGMNVNPTYASTDVPKTIADSSTVTSTLAVADNKVIQDVNVTIGNITHTYDGDLEIRLTAPDATVVLLVDNRGGTGENFVDTVFDDEAAASITSGAAPFTGSFQPEGSLTALDGKNAAGSWTLSVTDTASGDTGTLTEWSITFTYPAQSCGASLEHQSSAYADDCSGGGAGDGDTYIDPGEDVALQLTLHNNGTSGTTGVSATISTATPGITVTDHSATFPNIPADGTGASQANHFAFSVGTGVACGTVIAFDLHMVSNERPAGWDDSFSLTVGHTTAGTPTTVFSESFDGATFPPAGWTETDVSATAGDWTRMTTSVHPTGVSPRSGAAMAGFNSYTASSGNSTRLARSANVSIPAGSASASAALYVYHENGYTALDNIQVQTSPDGTTWTTRGTVNRYDGSTGWKLHTVDLSALIGAGNFQIGYLGVSAYGNDCHLDDVSVTYTPPGACIVTACTPAAAPPGETAQGDTPATSQGWTDKATHTWPATSGATSYRVYRGIQGQLSGLTSSTTDSCTKYNGASTNCAVNDDPSGVAGRFYWYLVTASNGNGEGTAGNHTSGAGGSRVVNSSGNCP
jgi:subtilisin-like proprotein convertase family protein